MARNNELIRLAKKAADEWRGTDAYHQAAQIIDMLVEELEAPTLTPPNEWVSVEERLPEVFEDVLVVVGTGNYVDIGWVKKNEEWDSIRGFWDVTHWMPLPAPPDLRPQEGEDDN